MLCLYIEIDKTMNMILNQINENTPSISKNRFLVFLCWYPVLSGRIGRRISGSVRIPDSDYPVDAGYKPRAFIWGNSTALYCIQSGVFL